MDCKELGRILKGFGKVLRAPLANLPLVRAFLRGNLYIVYYTLSKPNVKIKWPFFVYEKIRIFGPNIQIAGLGSVMIDRYCSVYPSQFHALSIVTLAPSAQVIIGKNCSLGGLTIRCRNRVTIGDRVMTAYVLVQDCLFVHKENVKSGSPVPSGIEGEPIEIGTNVWLGGQSCILGGSSIGNDSVVSWGSVCYQSSVGKYCLVSGNLARRPIPIRAILRLTSES